MFLQGAYSQYRTTHSTNYISFTSRFQNPDQSIFLTLDEQIRVELLIISILDPKLSEIRTLFIENNYGLS